MEAEPTSLVALRGLGGTVRPFHPSAAALTAAAAAITGRLSAGPRRFVPGRRSCTAGAAATAVTATANTATLAVAKHSTTTAFAGLTVGLAKAVLVVLIALIRRRR